MSRRQNDTDPMGLPRVTERIATVNASTDVEPVAPIPGAAPDVNPTDPGPPFEDKNPTDPAAPPVHEVSSPSPRRRRDINKIVDNIRFSRVPAKTPETRATDGHSAAAYATAPHAPQPRQVTPTEAPSILVSPSVETSLAALKTQPATSSSREAITEPTPRRIVSEQGAADSAELTQEIPGVQSRARWVALVTGIALAGAAAGVVALVAAATGGSISTLATAMPRSVTTVPTHTATTPMTVPIAPPAPSTSNARDADDTRQRSASQPRKPPRPSATPSSATPPLSASAPPSLLTGE